METNWKKGTKGEQSTFHRLCTKNMQTKSKLSGISIWDKNIAKNTSEKNVEIKLFASIRKIAKTRLVSSTQLKLNSKLKTLGSDPHHSYKNILTKK